MLVGVFEHADSDEGSVCRAFSRAAALRQAVTTTSASIRRQKAFFILGDAQDALNVVRPQCRR
jgi:hypothetical protein